MKLLGDRVLVALPPKTHEQDAATGYTYQAGDTTPSGLILAKPADVYNIEIATRGIVVQLGEKSHTVDLDEVLAAIDETPDDWTERDDDIKANIKKLAPAPYDLAVGECVIFAPSAGEDLEIAGIWHRILQERDIIGVVEPKGHERAWLESLAEIVNSALCERVMA